MDNKEFARQFEDRTKRFAISVLKLSAQLPESTEARVIRRQLTRSATSIGANYREANRARSKADFTSRVGLCESEASETIYWLEIIDEMQWLGKQNLISVIQESSEILAIFTSIGKTLKL